jgi:hypothetical protein
VADHRHDVGIDHRARGALIFLDLRQDLAADRKRQPGSEPLHRGLDQLLVRRIGIRVQEAHGDRLHAVAEQMAHGTFGVRGIERSYDVASMVHPLVDDDPQMALHQRRRLLPGDVVQARHPQITDLQNVPETSCGDQTRPRALVLQHRVRGDRGAVADL